MDTELAIVDDIVIVIFVSAKCLVGSLLLLLAVWFELELIQGP